MIRARARRPTARLQVAVTDGRGKLHPRSRSLERWLERHAPSTARGSVDIALISDRRMRTLNRTFRGVDTATDVLSFPGGPQGPRLKAHAPRALGDLAIAVGVAARQARAQGHDLATELRILALHGLLHLLGYDHERDQGTMRALEERLRWRAGLPAGLIRRTSARDLHR